MEDGNDDLLLLTMRFETDENSLAELGNRMLAVRKMMEDVTKSFDLSGLVAGLNKAVQALRVAVNAWNSLENKAINVATNRNYLPYGISAGEAETINTKISANKAAQKVGFTGGGTLTSLARIAEEQANIMEFGQDPSQNNWIALYTLGAAMGDNRFSGDNLSTLLTQKSSSEVLRTITDLMANASRAAYAMPEGSAERQKLLQYLREVQSSPYVPANSLEYIALMTKPENKTWGKSGNPMVPLLSATPEDYGTYGEKLETAGSKSLSIQEALSYLKTEREEVWNRAGTNLYNAVGEAFVLPFSKTVTNIAKVLSGKAMANQAFEGYSWWELSDPLASNPYTMANSPFYRKMYSLSVGLDETGSVFKGDLAARAQQALHYYTDTNNVMLGELGLYELSKMSQTDFAQQSLTAMKFAQDALIRNVTGDMVYTEGKKKGKKLSGADATKKAQELLTSPDSPYAQAYLEGGFTGLYAELYKNKALTDKEYIDLMEKVVNRTEHDAINKFYPEVRKDDEVTAKSVKENGKQLLRLEIVVTDEKTGKTHRESTELTPEQLSNMRFNLPGL